MTENEWQAHVTHEAARAIGTWLEERGGLDRPIASLTMADLEAMAANVICCFTLMRVQRAQAESTGAQDPIPNWLG